MHQISFNMNLLHICFAIFTFGLVYANFDGGSFQTRIVGGYEVQNRSNFSYQVSIRGNNSHYCGGVLYDNQHVLTAANCVANVKNVSELTVVLGDLNIIKPDKSTVNKTVILIKVHEKYNKTSHENDIAILTLKDSVTLNANISTIPLWNQKHPENNTKCSVSGWGTTSNNGGFSTSLRAVDLNFVNNTICKQIYGNVYYPGMICARSKGKDSCLGDNGGPLVCKNKLVGLVSWSFVCAHEQFPSVFTDISNYIAWIKNNTRLF